MKITPDHYKQIETAINNVKAENDGYPMFKDLLESGAISGERYRWDMLRAAKLQTDDGFEQNGISWICSNLYPYLDDSHIDTALRHITDTK